MKLTINGTQKEIFFGEKKANIIQFLEILKIKKDVVIELNEEIVKAKDFETTILNENDVLEILYFMGGGWEKTNKK